jgi:hypothetical protein
VPLVFRFFPVLWVGLLTEDALMFGGGLAQLFCFVAGAMLIDGVMTVVPISRGAWRL